MKQQIHVSGLETGFHPYPAAVKHAGLVFVSGVRPTGRARSAAVEDMQKERLTKEQGYGLADHDERKVSVELDGQLTPTSKQCCGPPALAVNKSCDNTSGNGTRGSFPVTSACVFTFRRPPHRVVDGVAEVSGNSRHWIGIDAIAVAPGENPNFPARSVVSAVDNRNLPSASHYSQAVRSGDLLFTAGHIAIKTAEPGKPLVNSFDDIPAEGCSLATGRSHPDSRDGPIAAQSWYIYNPAQKALSSWADWRFLTSYSPRSFSPTFATSPCFIASIAISFPTIHRHLRCPGSTRSAIAAAGSRSNSPR